MAKKKVKPTNDEVEVIVPDVEESNTITEDNSVENSSTSQKENSKKSAKASKESKSVSKKKDAKNDKNKGKGKGKNNKQKAEKKSLKKKAGEVLSELKKVSKPTFGTVVKNTSVVIVVVTICTLLLFGMDKLFSLVYNLLLS